VRPGQPSEATSANGSASTMAATCWGKSQPDGAKHPLTDHCLDVALVLRALLDLGNLARLGIMDARQKDRLAVIAYLHDFGKCNRGFQAKADPTACKTAGHVLEALGFLYDPRLETCHLLAWCDLMQSVAGWFADEDQALQMLIASISHHGRPISQRDIERWLADSAYTPHLQLWQPSAGYDPLAALDHLAEVVRAAFPAAFEDGIPPIDATPERQHRFAGLVMLADWIGSDTQFFPFRQSPEEDRLTLAQQAAKRALAAIGLTVPEPRQAKPFAQVFPFAPTPLQEALASQLEVGEATRLLLIESDTGSGKTEAALGWWMRLYAEGKVDGLYFALPTRVAARELYTRVLRAVECAFETERRPGPVLLAAPGYVRVDGEPVLTDPSGALWDDDTEAKRRERLWSAERPKRFLAAPVAVGTIDQALLSVLQVKHSLMRSVCLDRHLLVVDEVHASDPYMRELLKGLLRGHLARGGWALLLSATLGETTAAAYFGREPAPLDAAIGRPYPLISARDKTWPLPPARERTVAAELAPIMDEDETLIPRLIAALEAGARVLVVCNTVRRANSLFRTVESAITNECPQLLPALFAVNGVTYPHHGRFAREDRELLDAAVTAQLGKASPEGAKLLIGTQTLEQSLDIDADWLITDLAPMDVLVQRLGRLHRHDRRRPMDFERPRALVRVPAKALAEYLGKDGELHGPAGLGKVYPDGRVLAATWELLAANPEIRLPQQARELIERTTHMEALEALPEVWRQHRDWLYGRQLADIVQAMRSLLEPQPFGELHYPDKSEQVLTRLGDPTYDIPLAEPLVSPFGATIRRLAIPARWLGGSAIPDTLHAVAIEGGFRFSIGNQSFRYARFGLEKDNV
jgi:CRISPR-associated endonuclease/helicase Cas3